jgi:hypothetical protein
MTRFAITRERIDALMDGPLGTVVNAVAFTGIMLVAGIAGSGCAHKSATPLDNTPALIARPDFAPAAVAAPEWVRDALKTIAALEYEVNAAAPFGVEAKEAGGSNGR